MEVGKRYVIEFADKERCSTALVGTLAAFNTTFIVFEDVENEGGERVSDRMVIPWGVIHHLSCDVDD